MLAAVMHCAKSSGLGRVVAAVAGGSILRAYAAKVFFVDGGVEER